jgi:hypothetical protein
MAHFTYKRDGKDFILISEDSRIEASRHGWYVHDDLVPADVRFQSRHDQSGSFAGKPFYPASLSFTVGASSISFRLSVRQEWETSYLSSDERHMSGEQGVHLYPILEGDIPLHEADCTPFERGKVGRPYLMNGVQFEAALEGADSIERQEARDNRWGFFIQDFASPAAIGYESLPQSLLPAHLTLEMCKHLHKVYGAFLWNENVQAFVPDERLQENFDCLVRKATKNHTLVIDGEEYHFLVMNMREEYRGPNMKVAKKFSLGDAQVNGKSFPVRRENDVWVLDV